MLYVKEGQFVSGQNTSSAVMAQRAPAPNELDDFPTPPWAVRAACHAVLPSMGTGQGVVREPCVNRGFMALGLRDYFPHVIGADCHDYGAGYPVEDYLFGHAPEVVDWTIMNPPYVIAQDFIERALATSSIGVAAILRLQFVEGQDRHKTLYMPRRPSAIHQFVERVPMARGKMRDPSVKYWDPKAKKGKGAWKKPSTAAAYAVFVWDARIHSERTDFEWIPKCRAQFERAGDYDEGAGHNPAVTVSEVAA